MLKRLAVLLMLSSFGLGPAQAQNLTLQSSSKQVTLLELYTSEGCSSCPRADRWISTLKQHPQLWRSVVPVAFHVDYWDYIGWPDRFASPTFSQRQRNHAGNWTRASVYTPGLVQNGEEWRGWFKRPDLTLTNNADVGPLRVDIVNGQVNARFDARQPYNRPLEWHVAVLGFDISTAVKGGENSGKTLGHDFVVLGHQRAPLNIGGNSYLGQMTMPQARFSAPRTAVAAWVSPAGNPRPIQALGGWL